MSRGNGRRPTFGMPPPADDWPEIIQALFDDGECPEQMPVHPEAAAIHELAQTRITILWGFE